MNLPLSAPASSSFLHVAPSAAVEERDRPDSASIRRLRGLVGLFALYAAALFAVIFLSDGANVGCILAGIAGHVFYAAYKIATAWRDASWLAEHRGRVVSSPSVVP